MSEQCLNTIINENFNKLKKEHEGLVKYAGHIFKKNGGAQFTGQTIEDYQQDALMEMWRICNRYAVREKNGKKEVRSYSELKKLFKNSLWTKNKYIYRKMHFKKNVASFVSLNVETKNKDNDSFIENVISKPAEQFIKQDAIDKINLNDLKERFSAWLLNSDNVNKNDLAVYDLLCKKNTSARIIKHSDMGKILNMKQAHVVSSLNKLRKLFISFKEESFVNE